jgi:hypothetical protein
VSGEETVALSEAARFQRDLYLYLRTTREADGLPLTGRGYVSRPALRRVRAMLTAVDRQAPADADLSEIDDGRLYFLRRLLERLSLLTRDENFERAAQRLVAASTDQIAAYFAHSLAERLRICIRVWGTAGWWPDAPDSRATIPSVITPASPRIALARRRLIESLAALRPGEMGTIPDVATHGQPASKGPAARVRQKASPSDVEGETARAALTGPLTWLGFVRIADGRPASYVAESACGALVSSAEVELAEAHGRVTIQPDLSIVAYPPLTAPLLVALDLYANLERLDRVARYKLSRAARARSGRGVLDAEALTERLERLTETPLPENIRVTLRDWQRRSERLHAIERTSVLELDDAALLDTLMADRAARGWIERRLSAEAALIAAGHEADLRTWLLRHGELPAAPRMG